MEAFILLNTVYWTMRRRNVLLAAGGFPGVISGCLSQGSPPSEKNQEYPEWLQTDPNCSRPEPIGLLALSKASGSGISDEAIIQFNRFSKEPRIIINFAVEFQKAATCDTPIPFQKLLSTVDEYGLKPYRERYNQQPADLYIEHPSGLQRIFRLRLYDQLID